MPKSTRIGKAGGFAQSAASVYGEVATSNDLKTEGTSTTYGQDITLPDQSSESVAFPAGTNASKEPPLQPPGAVVKGEGAAAPTVVNVVEDTEETIETACGFVITKLKPRSKSSVALAAAAGKVAGLPTSIVVIKKSKSAFSNPPPTSEVYGGYDPGKDLRSIQKSIKGALANNVATVFPNVVKKAVVQGSVLKSPEEVKKVLEESQKVDLTITLKSKESESLDFNTIKIPALRARMVYNFFEEKEEIIEDQEDLAKDPLLANRPIDVPKYVQLVWDSAIVTEPVAGTELEAQKHKEFRIENFFKEKGTATTESTQNVPKNIESYKKKASPLSQAGVDVRIVDIHDPEVGFATTANNGSFPNSVATVIKKNDDDDESFGVSSLPVNEIV